MPPICSMRSTGGVVAPWWYVVFRWVNYQGLLEACVVGKLVENKEAEVVLPLPKPGD